MLISGRALWLRERTSMLHFIFVWGAVLANIFSAYLTCIGVGSASGSS